MKLFVPKAARVMPCSIWAALLSNKKESGHGYGLQIMRSVAEKYHCALAVRHDNGRFSVRADLLIPEDM